MRLLVSALPLSVSFSLSFSLAALVASSAVAGVCPTFGPGVSGGTVEEGSLVEASGLVASRAQPGTLWAHNDSGASATLYALAPDGTALATVNVSDATNVDWEDIALGPGPEEGRDYLYIGDIGDNLAARPFLTLYRLPEPVIAGQGETVSVSGAVALEVSYPDGPRDAETLLSDPATGDLFIVSKDTSGMSRVYRHAFPQSEDEAIVLEAVTDLVLSGPNFLFRATTAGDISPGGDAIAIRTYTSGYLWPRGPGESVAQALDGPGCPLPIEFELQGESLGFAADGDAYFTLSEQAFQPLYEYRRVPEPAGLAAQGAGLLLLSIFARARARSSHSGDPVRRHAESALRPRSGRERAPQR